MKRVAVIGTGTGEGTLTADARRAIESAEVIIGGNLTAGRIDCAGRKVFYEWEAEKTRAIIEREPEESFAVLVSGDVGFYSGAERLVAALASHEVTLVPGVSTVQAFFARLRLPWKDAELVSMHGGDRNIVDLVRRNRLTFTLTSEDKGRICDSLTRCGYSGIKVHAGENLGSENERVFETTAGQLSGMVGRERTVLVFENPDADPAVRTGIPDGEFIRREGIPMTKSHVRAQVMAMLGVRPSDVCWDVGCGTGSVAVEMAYAAHDGKVFAVDSSPEAAGLTGDNAVRFRTCAVSAITGEAPASLAPLPAPDAVFIGGSSGRAREIMSAALEKNPAARVAATAASVEGAAGLTEAFSGLGLRHRAVQLQASVFARHGGYTLPRAENPVFIICTES